MRLYNQKLGNKGVTLVELIICIALIAIIGTTTILISTSLSKLVNKNRIAYEEIENLTLARDYIENWFHYYDIENSEYSVEDNNLVIRQLDDEYMINCTNGKINADYPDGVDRNRDLTYASIITLSFRTIENTNLFECSIVYSTELEENKEFKFILGRRS